MIWPAKAQLFLRIFSWHCGLCLWDRKRNPVVFLRNDTDSLARKCHFLCSWYQNKWQMRCCVFQCQIFECFSMYWPPNLSEARNLLTLARSWSKRSCRRGMNVLHWICGEAALPWALGNTSTKYQILKSMDKWSSQRIIEVYESTPAPALECRSQAATASCATVSERLAFSACFLLIHLLWHLLHCVLL